MTYQVKNKYILLIAIGALGGVLFLGWVLGRQSGINALQPSVDALNGQISHYETEINDTKTYVATIEQENKTLRQAVKDGDIEREAIKKLHLKTVKELTTAEITINVLRDSVKHNGQVIVVHDSVYYSDPRKAILLPFNFEDSTRYHDFRGSFNKDGNLKTSLSVPVELSVWAGVEKKTKRDIAVVTSNNPEVKIGKISSVVIDKAKPKHYGLGVMIGYGINTKNPMSPSIVVAGGITYNFITF